MKHISSVDKRPFSIRLLLFIGCLLLTFAGITVFLFSYRQDEKLFARITARLFEQEMKGSTLNMHYTLANPADFGIYDYEAQLPCYSAQTRLSGQVSAENVLAALDKLHMDKLSDKSAYACQLLKRSLQNSIMLNSFPYYEEPLSPSSGMQSQLPILLAEYTFRSRRDVEDYLKLLEQTDEYFVSLLTFEREKSAAGLSMPSGSLKAVQEQCDTILSKQELAAGTHFLQTTFKERLQELFQQGKITAKEAEGYILENDRLLKTVMQPAYETLADGLFLLEDTSGVLSGLAAKPSGAEYYKYLLIAETGSYRSIEEIRQLLEQKFSEEYETVRSLLKAHPEIAQSYATESYQELPLTAPDTMLADLQHRMQTTFPGLPAQNADGTASLPTVTVKSVSENLEEYCAPAFYLTAPLDDTDNNVIYINNLHKPDALSLYTTLAHEGYPGHLYQTVYQNRTFLQNDENKIRQLLWYGGYLEGWALYVEFISFDYAANLLKEHSRTEDAVCVQTEKHNRSMQLCLYSMLDIKIHYDNASYQEIAAFLESLGITSQDSVSAIYTYIAREPCNYLKYYLGYLEILELKKLAEHHWAEYYSDYRFHRFYLDCGPSDFTSLTERLLSSPQSP